MFTNCSRGFSCVDKGCLLVQGRCCISHSIFICFSFLLFLLPVLYFGNEFVMLYNNLNAICTDNYHTVSSLLIYSYCDFIQINYVGINNHYIVILIIIDIICLNWFHKLYFLLIKLPFCSCYIIMTACASINKIETSISL